MGEVPAKVGKGPARGYSWPPFEPGNKAAVKHSLYSEEGRAAVAELVGPYVESMTEVATWLQWMPFAPEVRAWAFAEAEAEAWRQYLARVGFMDEDGTPRAGADALNRSETRAARLRSNLGLSPGAYAKMVAASVDQDAGGDAAERIKASARQVRDAVEAGSGE